MRKSGAGQADRTLSGLAYACAVVLALWGAVEHYSLERSRLASEGDPYLVEQQLRRLAGVAAALPPDAVIGYVSDLPAGSAAAGAAFHTAAYALAPRLLVPSTDKDWVLGNFAASQDFAAFGRQHGLLLIRDFGNGAVLFRRAEK